ncbi:MAG: DUF3828 domain-containing protein, partial [Brevundimonas sp.]
MRVQAMTAAAVLVLTATACSPAEEVSPAPVEAPAPLPPGREGAYQAAGGDPEGFVRALYAAYAATDQTAPEPGRDPLYTRTLNALVGEDFRRSNGKPWLKTDPVCDCTGGTVALTSVALTQADRTTAEAAVVFTVDGQERHQTLKLSREATAWRV